MGGGPVYPPRRRAIPDTETTETSPLRPLSPNQQTVACLTYSTEQSNPTLTHAHDARPRPFLTGHDQQTHAQDPQPNPPTAANAKKPHTFFSETIDKPHALDFGAATYRPHLHEQPAQDEQDQRFRGTQEIGDGDGQGEEPQLVSGAEARRRLYELGQAMPAEARVSAQRGIACRMSAARMDTVDTSIPLNRARLDQIR